MKFKRRLIGGALCDNANYDVVFRHPKGRIMVNYKRGLRPSLIFFLRFFINYLTKYCRDGIIQTIGATPIINKNDKEDTG